MWTLKKAWYVAQNVAYPCVRCWESSVFVTCPTWIYTSVYIGKPLFECAWSTLETICSSFSVDDPSLWHQHQDYPHDNNMNVFCVMPARVCAVLSPTSCDQFVFVCLSFWGWFASLRLLPGCVSNWVAMGIFLYLVGIFVLIFCVSHFDYAL